MKVIEIYSHVTKYPYTAKCGDKYDSQLILSENDEALFKTDMVNVDSSCTKDNNPTRPGIQKLELSNGCYGGIVGLHKNAYKAVLIIQENCLDKIKKWDACTEKCRTLPCITQNYNWNNQFIIKYVNIHKGSDGWDWSEGCITIHYSVYNDFIKYLQINEKLIIIKR